MSRKKPSTPPSNRRASEPSSSARRRLVTTGVATGLTLPLLPGKWTRPVVQAVLLPAHAQTSPECTDTVSLPGCEVKCEDEVGEETFVYELFWDGTCLSFTERDDVTVTPGFVIVTCERTETNLRGIVETSERRLQHSTTCGSTGNPPVLDRSVALVVDGDDFLVSYQILLTGEPDTELTIANITVEPV